MSLKSITTTLLLSIVILSTAQTKEKIQYKRAESTNLYDSTNYVNLLKRLDGISNTSQKKWGEMTSSQMLHHLNLAIGSGIGYYSLPDVSTLMSRGFNQFMILNVLKKFPTGTQTAKPLKVTESYDFEKEKKQLKEILTKAYTTKTDNDWSRHTYFGKMSRKAWGKLIMIHCNHHFQQFSN